MESMLFTARMDGKVTGINVSEGDAVQSGMTVLKLVSAGSGKENTVLYMPAGNGRKIRKGMKAAVYPSTVNRQEYGHMDGSVESVSEYTNTSDDLLNELGDPSLVQAFQQAGPVVRICVKLESDPDTVSGFKWSSRKGAEVDITEGTIVSADVVTEYKAPISMVVPYLKEKFTIKPDQEDED